MNHSCNSSDCGHDRVRAGLDLSASLDVIGLICLSMFLLATASSGRVALFVAPSYAWMTPAAGLLLLAMAVARFVGMRRCATGCGCEEANAGRRVFWRALYSTVLLMSVAAALLVHPSQFSAEGVRKRRATLGGRDHVLDRAVAWVLGQTSITSADRQETDWPAEPTVLDVLDWVEEGRGDALDGKFLSLLGQCSFLGDDRQSFELYRMLVVCCVADAQSLSLEVQTPGGVQFEEGQWVRVGGLLRLNDLQLPVLHAAKIERATPPRQPYL